MTRCIISLNTLHFLVTVIIVCLGYLGNFVKCSTELEDGIQWIYKYSADTILASNISEDVISKWSFSGNLIIKSFKNYKVFQLEEIKTNAFNGLKYKSKAYRDFHLPNELSVLTEPFLVHYFENDIENYAKLEALSFSSNEEEWSKNMKKGIASVFQVDLESITKNDEQNIISNERNIYGECKIKYENISTKEATKISKQITNKDCAQFMLDENPLGFFESRTIRYYTYNKILNENDKNVPPKNIKSKTTFLYWMSKSDRVVHKINQMQQLTFLNAEPIKEMVQTSKYTTKSNPSYNFQNDTRKEKMITKENLKLNWMNQFQTIKNEINQNVSTHLNEKIFNIVDKLLKTLVKMDDKDLEIFKTKFVGETQMLNIYESILPYIGTQYSVRYIKEMILNYNKFHLLHLRLLSLFPLYVREANQNLLETMEVLLDLESVQNDSVKQNFILSFSNLVYQMYTSKLSELNNITQAQDYYKNIAKKYVEKYHNLFLTTDDYSSRMKYLLGMSNMGMAATDNLIRIVQNTTESRHSRTLALYSIKPNMLLKKHETYKIFWPIVKNDKEPFELRAAALSLLLACNINSSQLYSILSYMNQTSHDPAKQQLHNYFYTSVLSGKTDCDRCTIKSLAKAMLSELNPPETKQGLITSYHQVSYTDEEQNFETSLNVHAVANPITNFINVFKLTLNHFTGKHKTGEFSVYVKAEGISSKLYKEEYERHFAIKELYKILQDMKIMFNDDVDEKLHIELIIYFETRAIFALHINTENVDEMSDFIDEIIVYIGNNDIITMRDVCKIHFVSDLGTPLYTTLAYQHILGTEFKNYDKIFLNVEDKDEDDDNYVLTKVRSMWSSKLNFMSYNPLLNMNHGISKVYSNQIFVKFKIDYNVYDLSIKWKDNTSYFDTLIDHNFATFVDKEENLQKVCSDCKPIIFIPTENQTKKELDLWLWVKNIVIRENNSTAPRFPQHLLPEIIKKSKVSYTGLPFAQPFVLLAYLADYLYYIPQYDVSSLSINTERIEKDPNLSVLKITFINDALDENYKLNLNFNITLALSQLELPSRKVLNHWNLNLQRQELTDGVYYELHYDDNDRGIKLDIHSDLDYIPMSPEADMFSLKPADPIISKTTIRLTERNVPPTSVDIISHFSVSDDQIYMVNASKSFELCQKDYESEYFNGVLHSHTPPTKSCYNASLGLSTYDNYAIYLEFFNVSDNIRENLETALLNPLKNKNIVDETILTKTSFNASIIYSALYSNLNVVIGKIQAVSNYSVPPLIKPWALLKPTSRLIDEIRYNSLGLDNVCIIIPKYVISFTGKIIEHDTDSSIIPLIECTNTTRLGLTTNMFTYKLWSDENTFQLGKKEGGYYVMRNGKYLKKNVRVDDYMVQILNDHTFHITTGRIDLYYNGEYLTIKLKSAFINRMCGMCTTNESIASNMMNKYFN